MFNDLVKPKHRKDGMTLHTCMLQKYANFASNICQEITVSIGLLQHSEFDMYLSVVDAPRLQDIHEQC